MQNAWEREAVSSTTYLLKSEDTQVQSAMLLQKWLSDQGNYSFLARAQGALDKYSLRSDSTDELPCPKTILQEAYEDSLREELRGKVKYAELAADLRTQWPDHRVVVIPVVIGTMGLIVDLQRHLRKGGFQEKRYRKTG